MKWLSSLIYQAGRSVQRNLYVRIEVNACVARSRNIDSIGNHLDRTEIAATGQVDSAPRHVNHSADAALASLEREVHSTGLVLPEDDILIDSARRTGEVEMSATTKVDRAASAGVLVQQWVVRVVEHDARAAYRPAP